MAEKKLARNVTVGDKTYEAGSSVPKDVADQINNPKAWEKDAAVESADESTTAARQATEKRLKSEDK